MLNIEDIAFWTGSFATVCKPPDAQMFSRCSAVSLLCQGLFKPILVHIWLAMSVPKDHGQLSWSHWRSRHRCSPATPRQIVYVHIENMWQNNAKYGWIKQKKWCNMTVSSWSPILVSVVLLCSPRKEMCGNRCAGWAQWISYLSDLGFGRCWMSVVDEELKTL